MVKRMMKMRIKEDVNDEDENDSEDIQEDGQ